MGMASHFPALIEFQDHFVGNDTANTSPEERSHRDFDEKYSKGNRSLVLLFQTSTGKIHDV